jgi:hypothetical protein
LLIDYFLKIVSTYTIVCAPEFTYYDTTYNSYFDAIVCKWEESNGIDHFDSEATALSDCQALNYDWLSSLGYATNTADTLMRDKYLASTSCGRYDKKLT